MAVHSDIKHPIYWFSFVDPVFKWQEEKCCLKRLHLKDPVSQFRSFYCFLGCFFQNPPPLFNLFFVSVRLTLWVRTENWPPLLAVIRWTLPTLYMFWHFSLFLCIYFWGEGRLYIGFWKGEAFFGGRRLFIGFLNMGFPDVAFPQGSPPPPAGYKFTSDMGKGDIWPC